MVNIEKQIKETPMLTEVDMERIMAAKRRLAESIASDDHIDIRDDSEIIEMLEEIDSAVTETNGLM